MTHHIKKSWPQFFQPIIEGRKLHDLRSMKEETFLVGDTIELQEYNPISGEYTGRHAMVEVTFVTSEDTPCAYSSAALERGYAILSFKLLDKTWVVEK